MSVMVRKQVYIKPRQDAMLKQLAKARKVSEAELIRQALDQQISESQGLTLPPDPAAWEQAYQFMRDLHAQGPVEDQGRTWTREKIYEERLSRYGRDSG